jgi:oligosaccharide repeat unit polymerase
MLVAALAILLWASRNIFAPLNLVIAVVFLPVFVGCFIVSDTDPRGYHLALLVAAGVLCAALGAGGARWWLHHNPRKELAAFRAKKVDSWLVSNSMFSFAAASVLVLAMAVVVLFFLNVGIPLLSQDVFIAKVVAAQEGGYLSVRFMRCYLPLLLLIYAVGYRAKVKPNKLLLGFTAVFILAAFTLFGYRSYVLNYLLLPFVLLQGYQKMSRRALHLLGGAAVGSAAVITAQAYGTSSFRSLWDILSYRLFESVVTSGLGPIVYGLVPSAGYLRGRGFWMDVPAALSRLGIGPPNLPNFAQYLGGYTGGRFEIAWQTGATLVGEAYANFGFWGIVIIMFLFGLLMQWLYVRTLRGPMDALILPLSIYVQLSLMIAAGGPFVFSLIDAIGSLLLFATLFVFLYIFWSLPLGGPKFRSLLGARGSRSGLAFPQKSG